jgi:hemerythrin-like domain-containing protein
MGADDPSASAIALIKSEHRALGAVLHALQSFTHSVRDGLAAPDFELVAAMLYYIETFPERFHHPKEDLHLFSALRRRTAALNDVLDALQADHVMSGQLMRQLEQALVHYQAGAPEGLANFCVAVDAFAALAFDHIRTEEEEVLDVAPKYLRHEDWLAIDGAFQDNNDPMFGSEPTMAFRKLRHRIANLVPVKLRPLFREAES